MDALQKLGIDVWGLVLYLVNFGVLILVLERFVFRRLLTYIDERRERITSNVQAAEEMRLQLEEERAKLEQQEKKKEIELEERLRAVKQVARDEAKRVVSEAEEQRDAILSQARKSANTTIEGVLDEAEQETISRIRRVVTHVLSEEVSEKVVQQSVEKSWKSLLKKNAL